MGTTELRTDYRSGTGPQDLGHRFAVAFAARDAAALRALLSDEISFRGLTPGRVWEAGTAGELIEGVLLGCWLEPSDAVDRVEAVETAMVGTRCRVGYRLRGANPDGRFVMEQQAYFDVADGKITWLRVLCSGFHPDTHEQPQQSR